MVGNPRGTPDTRRIRRLKTPRAIEVETGEDGVPRRIRLVIPRNPLSVLPGRREGAGGRVPASAWQDVSLVRRPWRIDQHWWRADPVRRAYYRVAPADGPALTLYHDETTGAWSRQEYR